MVSQGLKQNKTNHQKLQVKSLVSKWVLGSPEASPAPWQEDLRFLGQPGFKSQLPYVDFSCWD